MSLLCICTDMAQKRPTYLAPRALDVDVYVPGLVERAFGTRLFAAATGRRGGRRRSKAKAAAAKANGAKGGRPRNKNSRVPGGPVSSSQIGPPPGSTVISNRRNRQHCRSASTISKIADSASAGSLRRIPVAVSSLLSTRPTRPGSKAAFRVAIVAGVNVQTTGRSTMLSPSFAGLFRTGPRFPALKSYSSLMITAVRTDERR